MLPIVLRPNLPIIWLNIAVECVGWGVTGVTISMVRSEAQASHVRALAWEFIGWLHVRYPDLSNSIDEYLTNQNFEKQLEELLVHFNPPSGECLLAEVDGRAAGILMLKPKDSETCEMNRMYVREFARGQGVARAMCVHLIDLARGLGYRTMILSALNRHYEALPLYRSLGFEEDRRKPDAESAADMEVQMKIAL